jgi:hypothetical protein
MEGCRDGAPDENRGGGFERGGRARPLFDSGFMTFVDHVYQRADAFLFGRRNTSSSSATGREGRSGEPNRRCLEHKAQARRIEHVT